jgi:hypothetical protein
MSDVKAVLNESTNDLENLCKSRSVNEWAAFKPFTIDWNGTSWVRSWNDYSLGGFAGYNHGAKQPKPLVTSITKNVSNYGDKVNISIPLELGEFDFDEIPFINRVYAKMDGIYYYMDITDEVALRTLDFQYTYNKSSNYSTTIYLYLGSSSDPDYAPFPTDHTIPITFNYGASQQPEFGGVLVLKAFYGAEIRNAYVYGGNQYSFQIRVNNDQGWTNEYWRIQESENNTFLKTNQAIFSVGGSWTTVTGTFSFTPQSGDVYNLTLSQL